MIRFRIIFQFCVHIDLTRSILRESQEWLVAYTNLKWTTVYVNYGKFRFLQQYETLLCNSCILYLLLLNPLNEALGASFLCMIELHQGSKLYTNNQKWCLLLWTTTELSVTCQIVLEASMSWQVYCRETPMMQRWWSSALVSFFCGRKLWWKLSYPRNACLGFGTGA